MDGTRSLLLGFHFAVIFFCTVSWIFADTDPLDVYVKRPIPSFKNSSCKQLILPELVIDDDSTSLRAMYLTLNSPENLKGWRSDGGDPCGELWTGVSCAGSSVIHIDLHGLELTGYLGRDLHNLHHLKQLDISSNNIQGEIPYGLPPNLTHLNLSHNAFYGSIGEVFRGVNNLREMDLSYNNLSGHLPSSLVRLTNLSRVLVHNNTFTGSVAFLAELHLTELNIENNNFIGVIPRQFRLITKKRTTGNDFHLNGRKLRSGGLAVDSKNQRGMLLLAAVSAFLLSFICGVSFRLLKKRKLQTPSAFIDGSLTLSKWIEYMKATQFSIWYYTRDGEIITARLKTAYVDILRKLVMVLWAAYTGGSYIPELKTIIRITTDGQVECGEWVTTTDMDKIIQNAIDYVSIVRDIDSALPPKEGTVRARDVSFFLDLGSSIHVGQHWSSAKETVFLLYSNPLTWELVQVEAFIRKWDEMRKARAWEFYHLISPEKLAFADFTNWRKKLVSDSILDRISKFEDRHKGSYKKNETLLEFWRNAVEHYEVTRFNKGRDKIMSCDKTTDTHKARQLKEFESQISTTREEAIEELRSVFPDAIAVSFHRMIQAPFRIGFCKMRFNMSLVDFLRKKPASLDLS